MISCRAVKCLLGILQFSSAMSPYMEPNIFAHCPPCVNCAVYIGNMQNCMLPCCFTAQYAGYTLTDGADQYQHSSSERDNY